MGFGFYCDRYHLNQLSFLQILLTIHQHHIQDSAIKFYTVKIELIQNLADLIANLKKWLKTKRLEQPCIKLNSKLQTSFQYLFIMMKQELRILSSESRAKTLSHFRNQRGTDLIPIILFFNEEKLWSSFKQYKFVAANPQSTLLEFVKFLENRLVWDGYLPQNSPTLFLAIKQKQLTPTSEIFMKEIYDAHKQDGWLAISVLNHSAF